MIRTTLGDPNCSESERDQRIQRPSILPSSSLERIGVQKSCGISYIAIFNLQREVMNVTQGRQNTGRGSSLARAKDHQDVLRLCDSVIRKSALSDLARVYMINEVVEIKNK